MKKVLFTISILSTALLSAQRMTLEDGDVIFKGEEVLKYDVDHPEDYSVLETDGSEILTMKFHDNNTPASKSDDFFILDFENDDITIESDKRFYVTYGNGDDKRKNMKRLIQWLVINGVIDKNGDIDQEELMEFSEEYDENI